MSAIERIAAFGISSLRLTIVLSTNLGFRKGPTIPEENGAVARALFDELVNHGERVSNKERAL
jgi:hypothetical protein